MSQKKSLGLLASVALAGLVAASCGSSSGAPADAGADIEHKGPGAIVSDGSTGDDGGSVAADGTSGKPCTTDADCQPDGGPGINKCTNGTAFLFPYTGVRVLPLPTPVCKVPPTIACDPQPPNDPQGMGLHFCDGPDDPSSPGICIPGPNLHQGSCEIACQFGPDGAAPTGCQGKNTCAPYVFATDSLTGAILGFGFCQGSCQQDSDCSDLGTGWACQVDIGLCTKQTKTRTKQIGAACSQSARVNDLTAGTCNCQLVNQTTGNGFCTSSCVVGGSPVCPSGWVCDNGESALLPDQTLLSVENTHTEGFCVQACSLGGDAGSVGTQDAASGTQDAASGESDASGDALSGDGGPGNGGDGSAGTADAGAPPPPTTCPPNSTCQAVTPLGSGCWP